MHSFYVWFKVEIYNDWILCSTHLFVECSSKNSVFARIGIEYSEKVKKANSWHFNAWSKVKIIQYFWDCSIFSILSLCFVGFIFVILKEPKKNGLHLGCRIEDEIFIHMRIANEWIRIKSNCKHTILII